MRSWATGNPRHGLGQMKTRGVHLGYGTCHDRAEVEIETSMPTSTVTLIVTSKQTGFFDLLDRVAEMVTERKSSYGLELCHVWEVWVNAKSCAPSP